jgi:hypothetical protein
MLIHCIHVNSLHSCQFIAFMSIHCIHVNLSHSWQFMAFMPIHVNYGKFISIHVNSWPSCLFMVFMSSVIDLFNKFSKVWGRGGRRGQIRLPRPLATSSLSGRRQKEELEEEELEEEEEYCCSLDQVPTTSHLVKRKMGIPSRWQLCCHW